MFNNEFQCTLRSSFLFVCLLNRCFTIYFISLHHNFSIIKKNKKWNRIKISFSLPCEWLRFSFSFLNPTKRSTKRSEERKREHFYIMKTKCVRRMRLFVPRGLFSFKGRGNRVWILVSVLMFYLLRDAWNWFKKHYLPIRRSNCMS